MATRKTGPARPAARNYTIKKNDTLRKLAQKYYGDEMQWKRIYNANKDTIKNPDLIYTGKTLRIPGASSSSSGTKKGGGTSTTTKRSKPPTKSTAGSGGLVSPTGKKPGAKWNKEMNSLIGRIPSGKGRMMAAGMVNQINATAKKTAAAKKAATPAGKAAAAFNKLPDWAKYDLAKGVGKKMAASKKTAGLTPAKAKAALNSAPSWAKYDLAKAIAKARPDLTKSPTPTTTKQASKLPSAPRTQTAPPTGARPNRTTTTTKTAATASVKNANVAPKAAKASPATRPRPNNALLGNQPDKKWAQIQAADAKKKKK